MLRHRLLCALEIPLVYTLDRTGVSVRRFCAAANHAATTYPRRRAHNILAVNVDIRRPRGLTLVERDPFATALPVRKLERKFTRFVQVVVLTFAHKLVRVGEIYFVRMSMLLPAAQSNVLTRPRTRLRMPSYRHLVLRRP